MRHCRVAILTLSNAFKKMAPAEELCSWTLLNYGLKKRRKNPNERQLPNTSILKLFLKCVTAFLYSSIFHENEKCVYIALISLRFPVLETFFFFQSLKLYSDYLRLNLYEYNV